MKAGSALADRAPPPGERILSVAYDLFSRRGIRDVGVDELVARSGVAKSTFYRHYPSKEDLVLAFLRTRERRWTRDTLEAGARARGATPEERLLAIFDVFADWFARDDYEACSFINVLLEMGAAHPAGQASIEHLDRIRGIVAAAEGDPHAAQRGKAMARSLIEDFRR
jgi:AcrR family transcriptional regulator